MIRRRGFRSLYVPSSWSYCDCFDSFCSAIGIAMCIAAFALGVWRKPGGRKGMEKKDACRRWSRGGDGRNVRQWRKAMGGREWGSATIIIIKIIIVVVIIVMNIVITTTTTTTTTITARHLVWFRLPWKHVSCFLSDAWWNIKKERKRGENGREREREYETKIKNRKRRRKRGIKEK